MGLLNYQSQLDIPQGTNPVSEMDSMQGPSFDLGSNSTLQIDSLQEVPLTSLYQDLNGVQGPLFDFGLNSPLHAFSDGLGQILTSNEVPTPGAYNPYQSAVSPFASYGAGQPGGTYPDISPSPLASTPFQDLDGITPGGYINNLPT